MVRAEASLPDYYGALGLKPAARLEDIRKAFHIRVVRRHRPQLPP